MQGEGTGRDEETNEDVRTLLQATVHNTKDGFNHREDKPYKKKTATNGSLLDKDSVFGGDKESKTRIQNLMEQAENKMTVNPEYNGKDGTSPLRRLNVKDGIFRWDEESEASIQTQIERVEAKIQTQKEQAKNNQSEATDQNLTEQAKNKTAVNPKHNGKDNHHLKQYLKDKREEWGLMTRGRARERGRMARCGAAGSRTRATPVKISSHRNKVQDRSFTDKYLKGRTRRGDYAARHTKPSEGLDGEEKEWLKVNNNEDIQVKQGFIADLPPVLPLEVLREVATKDQVYQRLMGAGKQSRKPMDRDGEPHMADREEPGVQEELLCRGERIVIPEGQHKKDGGHGEGDTYLLANPGLVEAPDIAHSTVVPRAGADCSATQSLIDTNLLYMQHQYEDEESRHIDKTRHDGAGAKTKAVTNTSDSLHGDTHHGNNKNEAHQDRHRAGAKTKIKTKAEANIGDSLHGKDKNEAVTNLGDTHQDGHRAGVRTKAETNNDDSKAVTNLGDSHQDGHRAGVRTKAETNIRDSKAKTNLSDSHQDGHRAGDKAKAENNISNPHQDGHRAGARTKAENDMGDSKAVTNLGDSHQEGHRAGVKTKAETNIGDSKAMTNLGDSEAGHRAGTRIKAETNIGDSKAVTNSGDSHQEGHRAGVKTKAETKAETDIGNSNAVTNLGNSEAGHRPAPGPRQRPTSATPRQ